MFCAEAWRARSDVCGRGRDGQRVTLMWAWALWATAGWGHNHPGLPPGARAALQTHCSAQSSACSDRLTPKQHQNTRKTGVPAVVNATDCFALITLKIPCSPLVFGWWELRIWGTEGSRAAHHWPKACSSSAQLCGLAGRWEWWTRPHY